MAEYPISSVLDAQASLADEIHIKLHSLFHHVERQRVVIEQQRDELLQREAALSQREAELLRREQLLQEEKLRLLEEVDRGERLMVQVRAVLDETNGMLQAASQINERTKYVMQQLASESRLQDIRACLNTLDRPKEQTVALLERHEMQPMVDQSLADLSFVEESHASTPEDVVDQMDYYDAGQGDTDHEHAAPAEPSLMSKLMQIRFTDQMPLPPLRFRLKQELSRLLPSSNITNGPDGISIIIELHQVQQNESINTIYDLLQSLHLRADLLDISSQQDDHVTKAIRW